MPRPASPTICAISEWGGPTSHRSCEAAEGSDHGYDVVDPSRVDPARGGREGLERFVDSARRAGLGILVDIVPNHVGIADAGDNPWWWDVLLHGRASRYAEAFDIDWDFGDGRVRLPILGSDLEVALAAGEVLADPRPSDRSPFGELRYFDHILPLAEGTTPDNATTDAGALRPILERQHWELMFWRRGSADINYRRFFVVTTLAGIRVELPWVFDATHAEIVRWVHEGLVDGLRIDHPDGLLDPGGYLERLSAATDGVYVVVEKILEHSATEHPEALPSWWKTEGTTGYDAMAEIDRVLIDPAGERALDDLDARLRRETGLADPVAYADLIHSTKRSVADTIQVAEVRRLARALPHPVPDAEDALSELLACFPVYRSYLPAGREHLDRAAAEASLRRPDLAEAIARLVPLLADPSLEVSQRFQQTTGPVMAKGVEDTAFYRHTRLGTLTEVGGDPDVFALSVEGFHTASIRRQSAWPHAMTALSTHDTKRAEDVRARLSVLAEIPERWGRGCSRDFGPSRRPVTGRSTALLWQAIIGAWPATPERLHAYAEKAAREAGEATGWWDPDPAFEERMHDLIDAAFGRAVGRVNDFVREIRDFGWSNSLSAKLLQLAGPGVPDVYQGTELWDMSLVDPDNRRPVDFAARASLLADLDAGFARGEVPADRQDRSGQAPGDLAGPAAAPRQAGALHAVYPDDGGGRGIRSRDRVRSRWSAVAVATRLPVGLARRGGWGDTVLLRHPGRAVDVLTGRRFAGSSVRLAELLADYPVALLATEDES